MAFLQIAAEQTKLSYPESDFASPEFKPLTSRPDFVILQAHWKSGNAVQTNSLEETVSAVNVDAIRNAQVNKQQITIRGTIAKSSWSVNGKTFFIEFDGVTNKGFSAVIRQSELSSVMGKLGGDPEDILQKGVTLTLKGIPELGRSVLCNYG